MNSRSPYVRDLVLVGGGHANVQVLRQFGMKPLDGVRVTVISRESHSPYSGMLPGHVAGEYCFDELHIDLMRMCAFAEARFICDEVVWIDPDGQKIEFAGRPSIRYDALSINVGGELGANLKGREHVIPVKPIGGFLPQWNRILATLEPNTRVKLAIVGGGPGSAELALSISERHPDQFDIELITANVNLLSQHNKRAQRKVREYLDKANVTTVHDFAVTEVRAKDSASSDRVSLRLISQNEVFRDAHVVLWVAGVDGPRWLNNAVFALDNRGFLLVDDYLRSTSHVNVFASGDVASLVGQQRPKSGVFAVRQGPILSHNLRAEFRNRRFKRYRAQRLALAILRLENSNAVACRGSVTVSGRWVKIIKDRIDRRFMQRFQELPFMDPSPSKLSQELQYDLPETMRCGGCGAKLSSDVLRRVLQRLRDECSSPLALLGDDAAVVDFASSRIATSCDSFRAMISDPWRFGRISAHHALNDLYAVGSTPKIALAIASVPLMKSLMMEEDLYQIMSGSLSVFQECDVELVGGHSAEGSELTLGFAVSGEVSENTRMNRDMLASQDLIITKPIGTGVLLAGAMRGDAPARLVMDAVESMDQSNRDAAEILVRHEASALTDVTGFGLAGHVAEMMRASSTDVRIHVAEVPLLEGAADAMERGVQSSLQIGNELVFLDCDIEYDRLSSPLRLLADPQTCGGLVAAVPTDSSEKCVQELRSSGFVHATVIGQTLPSSRGRMKLV